jgi:hypothetical protein
MIQRNAPLCLPGEGRDPVLPWAPAFAGVTGFFDVSIGPLSVNFLNGFEH